MRIIGYRALNQIYGEFKSSKKEEMFVRGATSANDLLISTALFTSLFLSEKWPSRYE